MMEFAKVVGSTWAARRVMLWIPVVVLAGMARYGNVPVAGLAGLVATILASGVACQSFLPVWLRREVVVASGGGASRTVNILFLTDLHASSEFTPRKMIRAIITAMSRADRIDVIAFGGDYVDMAVEGGFRRFEDIVKAIRQALPDVPMIAVGGNHEAEAETRTRILLGKYGIRFLENGCLSACGVMFYGLADFGYLRLADDRGLPGTQEDWFRAMRETVKPKPGPKVLVAHNPNIPAEYAQAFDLVLSGHSHGGISPLIRWLKGHDSALVPRRMLGTATQIIGVGLGAATGFFGWLLLPLTWYCKEMVLVEFRVPAGTLVT